MMTYIQHKKVHLFPRLALEGRIDLTYRCNNDCRHCWLRIPASDKEKENELSFDEIKGIVDEARKMGCRKWSISGGEPMIRPDFCDIFDYLTSQSSSYTLNTNGALITPKIAKLMARKGVKMVALYGATAQVHDHITRNPGSFEATMRGFRYLKEAGAGFLVQLIPMKDNYHQYRDMVRLAQSLSKHCRIGAAWLYLSACGDSERNEEIIRQRLSPEEVVRLNQPDLSFEEQASEVDNSCYGPVDSKHLFFSCINSRRDFHIDPYGQMSFCCYLKDPSLRYDLRTGSFQDGWENFIPSMARKVKIGQEHKKNCGSCELRRDCHTCPVYAYLEHGDFNKRVEYLCAVAKANRNFKDNWKKDHRRYFKIADITLQVESDLPIKDDTFHPNFKLFQTDGPGKDTISIRHHFSLPDIERQELGEERYRHPPWAIFKKNGSWVYLGISSVSRDKNLHRVAVFNSDHSRAKVYNDKEETFRKGGLHSLTLFPSDQILLARVLADRQGCYLHSCGVSFKGKGLLFAGHSGAGKSTMARMLKGKAEILCDDRIIVRKHSEGFRIYGTWHHGDVPDVSAGSAPLTAIMFLKKARMNRLTRIKDKQEVTRKLLSCMIKPFVTADWWDKTLAVIEEITVSVPCYVLEFDKSGKAVKQLGKL
jgi:radical SAM protein with 4Fe4S-binding SPASM domain